MKFLAHLDFTQADRANAWVYASGPEASSESANESLLDKLNSPRSFGSADLRALEKAISGGLELTSQQKAKLNSLTEFHLSLVTEDKNGEMPSRVLFDLRYSSLWTHVRGPLARHVDLVMSDQRKKLQPLLKKPVKSFSNLEMHRFLAYYKSYDRAARGTKLTSAERGKANVISQKLVEHAQSLMKGFRIKGGSITPVNPDDTAKFLKTRDKFFILQVYRMLPDNYDWGKKDQAQAEMETFSEVVTNELAEHLQGTDVQQKMQYLPLWETIDDLTTGRKSVFEDLKPEQKETLRNFAVESRSAHLLSWVSDWQKKNTALLPAHVKMLRKIKKNPAKTVFKDAKELSKANKGFTEENKFLMVQVEGKKDPVEVEEAIAMEEEEIRSSVRFEAFEETRDAYFEEPRFKEFKKGFYGVKGDFPVPMVVGFEEALLAINGEDGDWEDQLRDVLAAHRRKIEIEAGQDHFIPNNEVFQFNDITQIFASRPYGESFYKKQRKVKKKIADLEALAEDHRQRIDEYKNLAKSHAQMPEQATRGLNEYGQSLETRLENRRLTAADMAVLLDKKANTDFTENSYVESLEDFRDKFGNVVETLAREAANKINAESTDVPNEDRMRIWYELLDESFGHERLIHEVKEAGLNQAMNELLDDTMSSKSVLDSVMAYYRDEIYESIKTKISPEGRTIGKEVEEVLANKDNILASYFSKYERTHHQLEYSTTREGTIDSAVQTFYRERDENKEYAGTLEEKLDEKFPNARAENVIQQIEAAGIKPDYDPKGLVEGLARNPGIYEELLEKENIRETDFHKKLKDVPPGISDESIERIAHTYIRWQAREKALRTMNRINDNLNDGKEGVPGRTDRQMIKLRAAEFEGDAAVIYEDFRHAMDHWRRRLEKSDGVDDEEISPFLRSIIEEKIPKLESISRQLRAALEHEFPDYKDDFIANYIRNIDHSIEKLGEVVHAVRQANAGVEWTDAGSNKSLKAIENAFQEVKSAFFLQNGTFKKTEKALENHVDEMPEAVAYLDDRLGLFQPGGKAKAKKKFGEMKEKYRPTFKAYEKNSNKVIKRLEKDIEKMKPKDFQERHGLSKAAGADLLKKLRESSENLTKNWDKYDETGYFNGFLERYENPETQPEAINEIQEWMYLENSVPELNKINADNHKWNKDYDEGFGRLNTQRLKRSFKHAINPNNWFTIKYTFSLVDLFYRMPKKLFEAFERQEERRREAAIANIGTSMFGNSRMGREFQRMGWEEQEKRVKEFETRYEKEPFHSWEKQLYSLRSPRDKDEARALINLLVNDGYMRWDKPELWRALNAIQRPRLVEFNVPDDLKDKSLEEIQNLVESACSHIWTNKIFIDWDGSLEGNLEKQMKSNYKNFDRKCNKAGALDDYFSDAIEKWKSGDTSINPAEFEGFLHRAFELAKYNSYGHDNRWFYLVLGMTVKNHRGETLLSHEAKDRFNKTHLERMPFFDFFVDNQTPKKDGKPVPPGTPGAHEGAWTHDDIQCWGKFMLDVVGGNLSNPKQNFMASRKFITQYIMNSETARLRSDRFGRMAGKSQDHDDAWIHGIGASKENLIQMLNRSSSGTDIVSPELAAQLPQAYKVYMEDNVEYMNDMDKQYRGMKFWEDEKQKKFKETGLIMQKMFFVLQSITGNFHGTQSSGPMVLDSKYWKEGFNSHTKIRENREKIYEEIEEFAKISGKEVDPKVFTFIGTLEVGPNYNKRKADPDWKEMNEIIGDIIDNDAFFTQTKNVEQFLES